MIIQEFPAGDPEGCGPPVIAHKDRATLVTRASNGAFLDSAMETDNLLCSGKLFVYPSLP